MYAVILAGGIGSRISEESQLKPKPMIEIGGRPMIWHIMKICTAYGIHDFIICLGYKGYLIKEYFANYFLHMSDVTFDIKENTMQVHRKNAEPWKVTLVDTGPQTMTGGRLKKIEPYLGDEDFLFTYGDGVADIDLDQLIAFHRKQGLLATVTGVQPPGRFGAMEIKDGIVTAFEEKPMGDGAWINGGFFVLSPKVIRYIQDDQSIWEQEPLRKLVQDGQLASYRHSGFWHPMDTLRDKKQLEKLWDSGQAPWKLWS